MEQKPKKEIKKRQPKTLKETLFVQEYVANGGNGVKAAMKVYDMSGSTNPKKLASNIASETLARIDLPAYLDKYNLGPDRYFKQMDAGLEATRRDQFSGEMYEDHKTRADYHKRLGQVLKIEGQEQEGNTYNQFNVWLKEKEQYGIS